MIYLDPHTRRLSPAPAEGFVGMDAAAFQEWAAPVVFSSDLQTRVTSPEHAARCLLRARIWERRCELQAQPFAVPLDGGRFVLITIDDVTLQNLTGKVVLGLAGGDGGAAAWKQADGSFTSLSSSDVRAAAAGFGARKQSLFNREEELYLALDEAVDLDALLDFAAAVEAF